MDLGLNDKVVLVTGGSKGIGLSCALGFVAEGARVAICSRSRDNLDAALRRLPGAFGIAADCSDAAAADVMVRRTEAEFGPIDILINSAGAARRSPPGDLTPAAWRAAMEAKYFSTVHVVDPVIKRMAARGRGVIVTIIGAGGKMASPVHLAGGAANAALMLATAGLGNAYASQGVRVVGINPALTDTDRVNEGLAAEAASAGISLEEARARAVARIPLGRMADPRDIANAALFLASDKAAYITAVTLTMDGGLHPMVV